MTREIGVDVTKQAVGSIILVETEDNHLFELIVKRPETGVVEISGTEPRLKCPVLGVLTHSFSDDKKVQINHWIGKLLKMSLVFKNGNFESKLVTHALIKGVTDGKKWKFEVF